MARKPLRRGWLVAFELAASAMLVSSVACVPAAGRPAGHHPASVEASGAPLPEPAAALGPGFGVDGGEVEPRVLEDEPGPARLPEVGVPPSRPLSADAGAGAESHHGH